MRASRALLLAVGVLLLSATLPGAARACSLVAQDPRDRLARADAAVYGEVVAAAPRPDDGPGVASGREVVYDVRVVQAFKGDVPDLLQVVGSTDDATCGVGTLRVGRRYGLLLSGTERPWPVSLASRISLAELRAGTAPFPRPVAAGGPIALVAAGRFGDARLVALDNAGRVLGYGFGRVRGPLSVCPGGRRMLAGPAVVRLADLRVVARRRGLPRGLTGVRCLDPFGRRIVASAVAGDREADVPPSRLVLVARGRARVLHAGPALEAVLGRRVSWLLAGRSVVRVEHATGRARRVARVPAGASSLAVTADGRRLAVTYGAYDTRPDPSPTRVLVVDLSTRAREARALRSAGAVGLLRWLGGGRLVFVSSGGAGEATVTFGPGFAWERRLRAPDLRDVALRRGVLWGVTFDGALVRERLPAGPARVVRRLPHIDAGPLAAVERGPRFRGSLRVPR